MNEDEVAQILNYRYQGRYTNLVLALLFPDSDWKYKHHIDHIYPQTQFKLQKLKEHKYDEEKINHYLSQSQALSNLQLLTEEENLQKSGLSFDIWLKTRDPSVRSKNLIPELQSYDFDQFLKFTEARKALITFKLKAVADTRSSLDGEFHEN